MTPGTYLRKRRQAAGLSIDQVVSKLAAQSRLATASFTASSYLLKQALIRIEGDAHVLTPSHCAIVARAFPFSISVYGDLARRTAFSIRICRQCACSAGDHCIVDGEQCFWSRTEGDLCSACENASAPRFAQTSNAYYQPRRAAL
jgi:hypothetical protein